MTRLSGSTEDSAAPDAESSVVLEVSAVHVSIGKKENHVRSLRSEVVRFFLFFIILCIIGLSFLQFQPRLLPIFLARERDSALDSLFQLHHSFNKYLFGGTFRSSIKTPLVFVDIDNIKMGDDSADGELIPRPRVLKLLSAIIPLKPKLVVLDIDISHKRPTDYGLMQYLMQASGADVPIVVAGSAEMHPDFKEKIERDRDQEIDTTRYPYFGAATIRRSSDKIIRTYPLWSARCDGNNVWIELSIPFLTHLLNEKNGVKQLQEVKNGLEPVSSCNEVGPNSTIDFAIPFNIPMGGSYGKIIDDNQIHRPLMWRIQATDILSAQQNISSDAKKSSESAPIVDELSGFYPIISNAIVVIGGSFAEGRDTYTTPIGDMPGAMIWINAIYTIIAYNGPIYSSNDARQNLPLVVISFIVVFLFTFLPKSSAVTLCKWTFVTAVGIGFFWYGQIWLVPAIGLAALTFMAFVLDTFAALQDAGSVVRKWVI